MKEEIVVRFATSTETDFLSAVISKVIVNIPYYNDVAKQDEINKFTSNALTLKIADDPYSVIVITVNNEIAGFRMSRFDDYTVWLEWFGILEQFRGKGLSGLLLNKLEETVETRNCHKIWCDCRTENQASIHILSSNGYKQIGTIINHWYNQDFIIWDKQIL